MVAHVADGVLLVDRRGVVRLWNPAAEAITAIQSGDVLGHSAVDAIPGWKDAMDTIPVSTSPDPGQPEVVIPFETEGGERWISISGVSFYGGTVYAFRDLTEVHHLEELKADFIATASHELRTPLAAVYGAAQTLLRHDFALDEGGRNRFISLIADESERLGRIVNEILLANQLDAGRLDLGTEPFDSVEVVERVVEATQAYAPAEVSLTVNTGGELPLVAGDKDKVRQVLVNLVENAIKYSPDGGTIEVGVAAQDADVRFWVRDEGLGIPEGEEQRIFEKFYRLDPADVPRGGRDRARALHLQRAREPHGRSDLGRGEREEGLDVHVRAPGRRAGADRQRRGPRRSSCTGSSPALAACRTGDRRARAPVIDHVTLRVSDFHASKAFYETVLAPLGYAEPWSDEEQRAADWGDLSISRTTSR